MVKLSEVQKSGGEFSHGLDFSTDCAVCNNCNNNIKIASFTLSTTSLQIRITPAELVRLSLNFDLEKCTCLIHNQLINYTNKIVIAA